jgi:hypothetical protein
MGGVVLQLWFSHKVQKFLSYSLLDNNGEFYPSPSFPWDTSHRRPSKGLVYKFSNMKNQVLTAHKIQGLENNSLKWKKKSHLFKEEASRNIFWAGPLERQICVLGSNYAHRQTSLLPKLSKWRIDMPKWSTAMLTGGDSIAWQFSPSL